MKINSTILIWLLFIYIGGCSDSEQSQNVGSNSQSQRLEPIKTGKVSGRILGNTFSAEQSIISNGTLTIRQGKDFFADLSLEIVTFESDNLAGKTFNSNNDAGVGQPQVRLGIKNSGKSLPDEKAILDGYDLFLEFGEKAELGIPYSIQFKSRQNATNVEGQSFATFKDIRMKEGKMDVHYDSFDTLEYLAVDYLKRNGVSGDVQSRFGASYKSYGKDYPKSGFIGLDLMNQSGEASVAKIQLVKDEYGWKASNKLDANQIHEAHPVLKHIDGIVRTVEGVKAELVAAQRLEKYLNKKGLISDVRTTRMSCYLAKDNDKGSCLAVYGLKRQEKTECHSKNYLLVKENDSWMVKKEILDTQQVDYQSGDLVSHKPTSMHCQ